MRRLLLAALVLGTGPATLPAQVAGAEPGAEPRTDRPGPVRPAGPYTGSLAGVPVVPAPPPLAHNAVDPGALLATPGGAFGASLLLPGAGQAALGLRRWIAYGALEVAFWALHLDAASDFRALSDAYRDLAWEAARLPTDPGPRQDGGWSYYETMSHYLSSGVYDREPGTAGVQPETDPATYNGSVWELAQGLFLPPGAGPGSEEYDSALAYYTERAVGTAYLWRWTEPDDLDRFRSLINDADGEARLRSTALGLVLANHVVAAVDALLVARLRAESGVRLESRLGRDSGAFNLNIGLRVPVPN